MVGDKTSASKKKKKNTNEEEMATFNSLYKNSCDALNKAIGKDKNDKIPKHLVLEEYEDLIPIFESAINAVPKSVTKDEKDTVIKKFRQLENYLQKYIQPRIARLQEAVNNVSRNPTPAKIGPSGETTTTVASFNKEEQAVLNSIVESSSTKFSDVFGNESAKAALKETMEWSKNNKTDLFKCPLLKPSKGILLFGPPGNGKTMLAKACAAEAGFTFISMSAATINSKWSGDGEKNMKAHFTVAQKVQPAIIYIDEIDSMCSARSEEDCSGGSSRRVLTQFLIDFDGVATKDDDEVLVLAATNRPQDLDEAVLRRFGRRILVNRPSAEARGNFIRENLAKTDIKFAPSEADMTEIMERTENYSFSDLFGLCREAVYVAIRELSDEERDNHFRKDLREIGLNDFKKAMETIKPSTTESTCQKMLDFAEKYAQST